MPKKIQNFARSALVKPVTVNVGRAGAANLDVVQEVEYVKQEAKVVYLLECLQKTSPPVSCFLLLCYNVIYTCCKTKQTITVCPTKPSSDDGVRLGFEVKALLPLT